MMIGKAIQFGFTTLALASTLAMGGELDRTDLVDRTCPDDARSHDLDKVTMDPLACFDDLVQRYRLLENYCDTTHLLQVTRRPGEEDQTFETQLTCEFHDDELNVETPAQQVREGMGLNLPLRSTEAMRLMKRKYQLWLAPHLALRFVEDPLEQLREGVEDGFTPRVADYVMLDDRKMLHLTLKSGDGLSGMAQATFDFYVNPESLLIEHIHSVEHRPDGSDFITTLTITPKRSTSKTVDPLVG